MNWVEANRTVRISVIGRTVSQRIQYMLQYSTCQHIAGIGHRYFHSLHDLKHRLLKGEVGVSSDTRRGLQTENENGSGRRRLQKGTPILWGLGPMYKEMFLSELRRQLQGKRQGGF